jgi:acetoacetyl-CoA reductase/3-oxoacyl-[acyl-carrier protein] reductase
MPYDFSGRTAIVTGGMRGIGRVIVNALVEGRARVHVFDRDVSTGEADGFAVHALDVRDSKAVTEAVTRLPQAADLLVNNAGIARDRSIVNMSDEEWRSVIDVNLTGAFHCIRAAAPSMRANEYGRIVNISSINGLRGKFGQANYSASKAGLIALTKTAARELGGKGITVNAVAPGMVLTEMTAALDEGIRARAQQEALLPRLPDSRDVAAAVLFLLSDEARSITGQVLQVDAGQYL